VRLSEFVGNAPARLALLLNAVEPRCGGLLLLGGRGTGKSTLARLMPTILGAEIPFLPIPLHAAEEALLGGIDLEATLARGRRILQTGILSRVDGGFALVDDIHLWSPEARALVLEVQGRGELILEREGLSSRVRSRFALIATAIPDEGELPSTLLDRFGLCAAMERAVSRERRVEILRLARSERLGVVEQEDELADRVVAARERLARVRMRGPVEERLLDLVQGSAAAGHRAESFLWHACRACAALEGADEVSEGHLETVAPLVLAHRQRQLVEPPSEESPEPEPRDQPQGQGQEGDGASQLSSDGGEQSAGESLAGEGTEQAAQPRAARALEEVQGVGRSFSVRRLFLPRDRIERKASGRRTVTRSQGRGGRAVRSTFGPASPDVALDATLRACAPFQRSRGRLDRLIIALEDLRYRQRERRMRHLVLFVVDGSGSMGARRRMSETKGAIASLLADCYEKRDKVAMIVFRKDRAETVLPPTASVVLAQRRLAVLPVGGRTPLAAGLLEARRLIRSVRLKEPKTRVLTVLLTDGRANHGLSSSTPLEDAQSAARLVASEAGCDFIVVDTEDEKDFLRTGLARKLAETLGAAYHTTASLRAEELAAVARARTGSSTMPRT
jgi:magnesium chelatase subunit D